MKKPKVKQPKKVKEEIVIKTDLTFEELLDLAANTPPLKKDKKVKKSDLLTFAKIKSAIKKKD